MRGIWVTTGKVKSTIKNQDTLHIENTICLSRGVPKVQGQISFDHGMWATSVK